MPPMEGGELGSGRATGGRDEWCAEVSPKRLTARLPRRVAAGWQRVAKGRTAKGLV